MSYEVGLRERTIFSKPVLSIGNIEAGGTGKTPLVLSLCRWFLARGKRPGIVSRGYGRTTQGQSLVVCKGQGPILSASESGDEPALYARRYPDVPVAVSGDRRIGVEMIGNLCDLVLLDDGFQSLEIRPSASLVFLPSFLSERPSGLSDLLPSGSLREPVGVLSRATHWVMSSCGNLEIDRKRALRVTDNLARSLPREDCRPILFQRFHLSEVSDFQGRRLYLPGELAGQKVAVVLGIANPGRVRQALKDLGVEVVGMLALPDHASYLPPVLKKVEDFSRAMKEKGANLLLSTEKDRVKWDCPPTEILPVGILEGEAELLESDRWDHLLANFFPDCSHGHS